MEHEKLLQEFGAQNKTWGCITDSGSNLQNSFGQTVEDNKGENEIEVHDIADIISEDFENSDSLYKLPTHQKCSAHLRNLIATKDSEKALSDPELCLQNVSSCGTSRHKAH